MRKILFLLLIVLLTASIGGNVLAQDDDIPKVGVLQFVSHPALDAGRQGAVDYLDAAGYVDGETIEILVGNGEGDIPTLSIIAEDFVNEEVDAILAVSTPSLQAAFSATQDLEGPPVIFNTVTSPYAAGVADAPCIHPAWVTGSQALAPYDQTVPLVTELVPDAETIGLMYNDAEANSVVSAGIVTEVAEAMGLNLEVQTIANSSEVPTAAEALVSRGVDAFYVTTDSTVVAAFEGLAQVANDNGIPLLATDVDSSPRGAVVAQGLDYYQDGVDAGRIIAAYLDGDIEIAETSISRQQGTTLWVNLDAAEAQGVEVPESILERAAVIIEDGEQMEQGGEGKDYFDLEAGQEFVEELQCTEEEIQQQQEELEAEAEDE